MKHLINPDLPANAIVGTATCPMGAFLGHDGDACRANQVNDGKVVCIFCGTVDPELVNELKRQPRLIQETVALLVDPDRGAPFQCTAIVTGSGEGAVAQGFGPEDIMTRLALRLPGGESLSLTYTGCDVKFAAKAEPVGAPYQTMAGIPESLDKAARKLAAVGFYVTASGQDPVHGERLTLVKGGKVHGARYDSIFGIKAEFHWGEPPVVFAPYDAD